MSIRIVHESNLSGPPGPLGTFSDAARRASDTINNHLMVDPMGNHKKVVAIRLSDGGSDGVVYDDVAAAANHQLHYKQCMYIRIPLSGMTPQEAEAMLNYHRRVYDAGNVPPYLDGVELIIPPAREHLR